MPDRAELSSLRAALEETSEAVGRLASTTRVHQATLRRVKVAIAVAAIAVLVALAVAVFVYRNQQRLDHLQAAMQVETDRNKSSQCAMIALFVQFEPKTTTNPNYTGEQRQQQLQAYQTLRGIAHDLGCANL